MGWFVSSRPFTSEIVEDDIAALIQDSASITWTYDDPSDTLTASVDPSGVDHGGLAGLLDDDHTQYFKVTGRTGENLSSSGNVLITDTAKYFSSPGVGTGSEKFGVDSSADGDGAVAFGKDATATGANSVAIGKNSNALDGDAISIGRDSSCAVESVAIGPAASCSDTDSVAIGKLASSALSGVAIGAAAFANNGAVAIGSGASASDTNVLAIGPGAQAAGGLAIGPSVVTTGASNAFIGQNVGHGTSSDGNTMIGSTISLGDACLNNLGIGNNLLFQDGASQVVVFGSSVIVPSSVVRSLVFAAGEGATIESSDVVVFGGQVGTPLLTMYLGNGEYWDINYPDFGSSFTITPTKYRDDYSDQEGVHLVLEGGLGRGTGGSGEIIFKTGDPVASGSDPSDTAERFKIRADGTNEILSALALAASDNEVLTADNQAITVGSRSHIVVSSDNATATNRTFTLSNGIRDGQILVLEFSGTNQAEIVAGANIKLPSTMTFTQYYTLVVLWSADASAWLQLSRSANA